MKKSNLLVIVSLVLILMSCNSQGNNMEKEDNYSLGEKIIRTLLYPFRAGGSFFFSKEQKLAKDLYRAVYGGQDPEWVKETLEAGADPNYCDGECGWVDSNPLNVVAESFYNTYYRRKRGETIPDPAPDVETLKLLVEAGADINRWPYVWDRVYTWNNENLKDIKRRRKTNNESIEPEAMKGQINNFVEDANRLIKAFLEAGADVDKKGHPYPFSSEAMDARINDKKANEYFAKGSRAINVAIEKGMVWESQVDLLLKYTKLDEESLKAAERSNAPEMIKKITQLWQEQQK